MTFPLPGANWSYLHSLRLVATTGSSGFALQNATPTILSWTAPNDGNMHRALVMAMADVSSAMTGGDIYVSFTAPDNTTGYPNVLSPQSSAGVYSGSATIFIKPNTTITITQTALTAGAAKAWAEIWAY